MEFSLISPFEPAGDQPNAIDALIKGIKKGKQNQTLLGVTGSGKTFTMAQVVANLNRPALIMAHNKTLAAQLYEEMKGFFPNNAVEYFVSYYDYYQPEAYVPRTDTFIEKDSSINEQIDLLRHRATRALMERRDVIVVASVSCIYGLGSPELYQSMTVTLEVGQEINLQTLMKECVEMQYERNDVAFTRGTFRVKGDVMDIYPAHLEDRAWRFSFFGNELEEIIEFDALTGERYTSYPKVTLYARSHFVTPKPTLHQAADSIKKELQQRLAYFTKHNQLLEAQRIEQRTSFDIEMMQQMGVCKGIENYSRYLSGRNAGEPPPTLFEYLPKDALLFVDESHVTTPQIGGMFKGDRARKLTLVEHGFRLPSALDNRPLKFAEWDHMRPQTIFVSATPAKLELDLAEGQVIEQLIRPTGLIDPVCEVRPVTTQVDDLLHECQLEIKKQHRVLVTTLTKKMAEDLCEYMRELGLKVEYLHSDVHTLDRIELIHKLRAGEYDILVGVNLLREGLDIPEVGLVAILDADKEGFLRSETSLIQTIGRAARHVEGRVILYADKVKGGLKRALDETKRRRDKQIAHNQKHGITPQSIQKAITNSLRDESKSEIPVVKEADIEQIRDTMLKAASNLEFEEAARLRDQLHQLEQQLLGISQKRA